MATTTTPTLISVREAARLANVDRSHIYKLIQRDELPAIRVGDGHGPIRLDRGAFLAWLFSEPTEEEQ